MSDYHWTTAITAVQPNEVRLRGYRIDELMGRVTFGQAVYLALKGELPSPEVGRLGRLHRCVAERRHRRWGAFHQPVPRWGDPGLHAASPGKHWPARWRP